MADWGDGVSASCTVVQLSVSAGSGWPHNALRHHRLMPISCHFRDCKALLVKSLTSVSGAVTSAQNFTFACTGSHRLHHQCHLLLLLSPMADTHRMWLMKDGVYFDSAPDICPLIHETLKRRSASASVCRNILPTIRSHVQMLLRLVVVRTASEK